MQRRATTSGVEPKFHNLSITGPEVLELIEWAWLEEIGKTWLVVRKEAFDSAFGVVEKCIERKSVGGSVSRAFGRKLWILKTIPYTTLDINNAQL